MFILKSIHTKTVKSLMFLIEKRNTENAFLKSLVAKQDDIKSKEKSKTIKCSKLTRGELKALHSCLLVHQICNSLIKVNSRPELNKQIMKNLCDKGFLIRIKRGIYKLSII